MQIRSVGVMVGVTLPIVKFWDPPYISGTAEARNVQFCILIEV